MFPSGTSPVRIVSPGGIMMNSKVTTDTSPMPMVTSSFKDRDSAEHAFAELQSRGYTDDEIHVVMSDDTRKRLFTPAEVKDSKMIEQEHGHQTLAGAGVGGAVGGAVGATILALITAGAALTIPGIGLVIVGPLAGALAGGATGAAAGGLIGTLVGAGIPDDRARIYEKDLRDGSILLGVTPHHEIDGQWLATTWHNRASQVNG
jgi:hypothetical protein